MPLTKEDVEMMSALTQWQMWVMALLPAGIASVCFRFLSKGWSDEAKMYIDATKEVADMYADQRYKDIAFRSGLRSALAVESARARKRTALFLFLGFGFSFVAFLVFPTLTQLPTWVTVCAGVAGFVAIVIFYN